MLHRCRENFWSRSGFNVYSAYKFWQLGTQQGDINQFALRFDKYLMPPVHLGNYTQFHKCVKTHARPFRRCNYRHDQKRNGIRLDQPRHKTSLALNNLEWPKI